MWKKQIGLCGFGLVLFLCMCWSFCCSPRDAVAQIIPSGVTVPPVLPYIVGDVIPAIVISYDLNKETDIAGYKVYYGELSGQYTETIDMGNTNIYTILGLTIDKVYYIVITAYDTTGHESIYSEEVSSAAKDWASPDRVTNPIQWPVQTGNTINIFMGQGG